MSEIVIRHIVPKNRKMKYICMFSFFELSALCDLYSKCVFREMMIFTYAERIATVAFKYSMPILQEEGLQQSCHWYFSCHFLISYNSDECT